MIGRAALLAAIVVAGATCFVTPPAPHKPPDVTGCQAMAAAMCMLRDRCSAGFINQRDYGDEPTCEARTAATCILDSQILNTGSTPQQHLDCATQTSSESCDNLYANNTPAVCQASGSGADGLPCGVVGECAHAYCAIAADAICGACALPPAIGDACTDQSDCGRNLACVVPSGASGGTCAAWVLDGQPCNADTMPCLSNYTCVGATATATGTCMPSVANLGAICDPTRKNGPGCDGTRGLICISSDNTCHAIALGAPGAVCGSIGMPTTQAVQCDAGGLCAKASPTDRTGICVATVADGAPCDSDPSIGPPCLHPAKCVPPHAGTTAGICTVPDARMCN